MRFLGENYQIIFKLLTNQLTEEEFEKTGKSIEDLKQISKRFGLLIQRSFGIAPMMQKELIKTQNQEVIKEGKADCHLDSQPCYNFPFDAVIVLFSAWTISFVINGFGIVLLSKLLE